MITPAPTPRKSSIDYREPITTVSAREFALKPQIVNGLPSDARVINASYCAELSNPYPSNPSNNNTYSTTPPTILINTRARSHYEISTGFYATYALTFHTLPTARSAYNSAFAIHRFVSSFIARPFAWGTLPRNTFPISSSDTELHYYLCRHIDVDAQILNIPLFVYRLAELHRKSMGDAGRWGFWTTTVVVGEGKEGLEQRNGWCGSWEEYFRNNFVHFLELEEDAQGLASTELSSLSSAILEEVIPRLLRPLEWQIQPCLLHGDVTPANVGTCLKTRQPVLSNPCAFYGHNEYDLRCFHDGDGGFGSGCVELYERYGGMIAEPREEFGARLRLYALRGRLHEAIWGGRGARERLAAEMRWLVDEFGDLEEMGEEQECEMMGCVEGGEVEAMMVCDSE